MRALTLMVLTFLLLPVHAGEAEDRALLLAAKSGHAELAAFGLEEGAGSRWRALRRALR